MSDDILRDSDPIRPDDEDCNCLVWFAASVFLACVGAGLFFWVMAQ